MPESSPDPDQVACGCGHPIRHHESYPYLDGVVCKGRVNKEWCKCPLTHDEALRIALAQAWRAGVRTALDYGTRNEDGITLDLDPEAHPNPYVAAPSAS